MTQSVGGQPMVWRAGVTFPEGESFLFSINSRPTQGPTQSPIQTGPGTLSAGVKQQGRELTVHLHLMRRSRMWSYTSTPETSSTHSAFFTL
jgi:hypothetical protein